MSMNYSPPYPLSNDVIEDVVEPGCPGVYVLYGFDNSGRSAPRYVGRADRDLRARLRDWLGDSRYMWFVFAYASSPKKAYEEECHLYHQLQPLDNRIHPDRPNGAPLGGSAR